MDGQIEIPAAEMKRLRRCINDLVRVLALPASWSGREPSQISSTLLDVLLSMFDLDLIYLRLDDPSGGAPVEMGWGAQPPTLMTGPKEVGRWLKQHLGDDPEKWPPLSRSRIGDGEISIVPLRLGLQGEIGVIVTGAQRPDFPRHTETLLLSVLANQAMLWLQESRRLSEQKRIAEELERRVAHRTSELGAANEELRRKIAERKLVEEKLRGEEGELKRNEARMRAILESALDCIVTIDHEGRITEFNPAAERTFGYRREEVMGKHLADVIVPSSLREQHRQGFARYLATGNARVLGRRIEMTAVRSDGSEFPVELAITRIPFDGPPSFTGYVRDITERKKAEAIQAARAKQMGARADVSAAFAEEGNLRTILNSCAGAIVNNLGAAFARIWMLNEIENVLVLQASAGLYTNLNGTQARVPVGQLKIGRIAYEGKPHLTNDVPNDELVSDRDWARREGMVAFAGYPLFIEGRVIGVMAMFARHPLDQTVLDTLESVADIIAQGIYRKDAENKLSRSEAYLAEAQKLSHTGSFGWRVSSDEHTWSDETFRIFEYDPALQVTLQMIMERVHPEDLPIVKQAVERASSNGEDWEIEYRLLMPNGAVKHVHVVAHAIGSNSSNREFVGAVMDVTAARRTEETMRRGQAELAHVSRLTTLGEFAASIAHEVNQPLTAIVNNANACLDLLPAPAPHLEEVRSALEEMIEDAGRATAVIAGIRQLARKSYADRVLLDMGSVVTDVLALVRHESRTRRVTTHFELSEKLPPVLGDRVQLQQVLLNLIVNGMDAMNTTVESRRVLAIGGDAEIRNGRQMVILAVQDSGIGIKPEEMARLFEAFYTTKSQGMGMGLAISRSIIEAHGGRLWAESAPGNGATFLFSLPAVAAAMP